MITESSLNVFCKKPNRRDSLQNCHFPNWDFHKSSIISRDSKHTPATDPAAPVAFLIKRKGRVTGVDVNEGDFFPGLNNSRGRLRFPPLSAPSCGLWAGRRFSSSITAAGLSGWCSRERKAPAEHISLVYQLRKAQQSLAQKHQPRFEALSKIPVIHPAETRHHINLQNNKSSKEDQQQLSSRWQWRTQEMPGDVLTSVLSQQPQLEVFPEGCWCSQRDAAAPRGMLVLPKGMLLLPKFIITRLQ